MIRDASRFQPASEMPAQRPCRLVAAHRLLMQDLRLQGLERIGRGGGSAASGRAGEPMLLDPDMIEGEPAAHGKDRGEQQRHPGQRRPAADHRRDKRDHDRDPPRPALQQAQLARGEPAPILRHQSSAEHDGARRQDKRGKRAGGRDHAFIDSAAREPANEGRRNRRLSPASVAVR